MRSEARMILLVMIAVAAIVCAAACAAVQIANRHTAEVIRAHELMYHN